MDIAYGRLSVVARIEADSAPAETATFLPATLPPEPATEPAEFARAEEKYAHIAAIGRGGMGEVHLVHDRDLRRDVAMKLILGPMASSAAMRRKFVTEAQATSQLEHPGILPVHDIGVTPDGKLYFTMKVVRGRTLSSVVRDLLVGVKEVRQEYTLHRLMTVMERIAEAVHFAHEKGVLHRDLKPENIMLGSYGETHVMDWGLAKVGAEIDQRTGDEAVRTADSEAGRRTQVGTIQGTVPYMSPEQARGLPLDRRSDVYALGAILYETLALHPAFDFGDGEVLLRVRRGDFAPVETRNPRRPVPEALGALCRKAMANDPAARPATAREFAHALRAWLDGSAEKERRRREAESLAAQGRDAMAKYAAAKDAVDGAERRAAEVAGQFKSWQGAEEKRPLRAARRAVDDARHATVLAFAETTKLLEAAIVAESNNATARGLLADLWRGRLVDAERSMDRADAAHALTMLRRYDDGRLAAFVAGDGALRLTSDPPGARVALLRFTDDDGMLVAGPERDLGATPLAPVALPMGSYLAILRHPGFPDVRYPVHIARNRAWEGTVRLRTREEVGDGFVHVPGGPFVYGEGRDARTLELPDFAIAAKPLTFGDWAEFLAAVERERGVEAAQRLCPSTAGDGPYMTRRDDGTWRASPNNCEGPARERCLREHGPEFDMLLPLGGVSWFDAAAWCEWKTRKTGREWRLPTEQEREKAARGVDGRRFPWGDLEDPSLLKCRESRQEPAQPEPVGAFPAATSVYGMVDAAGSSWDWTSSLYDEFAGAASFRVLRGGSWDERADNARCAFRTRSVPGFRFAFVGFRPARHVAP